MSMGTLTVPTFYDAANASVWGYRPDHMALMEAAKEWRETHDVKPVGTDRKVVSLLIIDAQQDFCHSDGALYVAGAEDDCARTAEFIYRELGRLTRITCTLDSHLGIHIFFPSFWLDESGNHPAPGVTQISTADIKAGKYRVNPAIAKDMCGGDYVWLQQYALHYCEALEARGRYTLMIWPPLFFPSFWLDESGNHPAPGVTQISTADIKAGKYRVNPAIAKDMCGGDYVWLQQYALHYCEALEARGRYTLMIWPPHCIIGEPGHGLMGVVQEARQFHGYVRGAQTWPEIKGANALTENYSVFGPEVTESQDGRVQFQKNTRFIGTMLNSDVVIIMGQAKSHCVAWTIDDLLNEINAQDPSLVRKVYLVEDCTSPVIIPGVIDFTDDANAAFEKFRDAGMHVVKSTDPMESWPDVDLD